MNDQFKKGFQKVAKKISFKTPSFGKSLRGSAFSNPTKAKVDLPKFKPPKGNAKRGYKPGGTAGIKTNQY